MKAKLDFLVEEGQIRAEAARGHIKQATDLVEVHGRDGARLGTSRSIAYEASKPVSFPSQGVIAQGI